MLLDATRAAVVLASTIWSGHATGAIAALHFSFCTAVETTASSVVAAGRSPSRVTSPRRVKEALRGAGFTGSAIAHNGSILLISGTCAGAIDAPFLRKSRPVSDHVSVFPCFRCGLEAIFTSAGKRLRPSSGYW